MEFRKMLTVAAVAASVSLAGTASAETVRYEFSCNSDGFIHVIAWQSSGLGLEYSTGERCGPNNPTIAVAGGFDLVLSDKTQVSTGGQAFLNTIEKGAIISPKRVPEQGAGKARSPSGRIEKIQLNRDDVGPHLAALLTSIAPDWRRGDQAGSKKYSIFDRWGNLITARGPQSLVPGDMGMTIPSNSGDDGKPGNAKQRCLDKHGFWRNTGGDWGCWTSAK